MKKLVLITVILLAGTLSEVEGQNVAITDDNAYTAHSSAMLDVKSLTKGFLAPRMTTVQRDAIVSPATGLLVFDTNINGYYYYNGTDWINLSTGGTTGPFWSYTSPNIYMTIGTDKLGLGTSSPSDRLIVTGTTESTTRMKIGYNGSYNNIESGRLAFDENVSGVGVCGFEFHFDGSVNKLFLDAGCTAMSNIMTFERDGNIGIGTTTPETKLIVKGSSSTGIDEAIFAVQNNDGDTVFAVYPEGVRIWVNDAGGTKANGSRGGFAVGGFNPAKAGFTNEYFRVTPDSVRVYIDDDFNPAKANGSRGGFAVGGFNPAKGTPTDQYLFVQDDSTRVYVADSMEGFGVENIEAIDNQRIMKLTTENYFIGHETGQANTTGIHNIFTGYQSGYSNTTGFKNAFFGYQAGYSNIGGTGDEGSYNAFIGNKAGYSNTAGYHNTFVGHWSGQANTTGYANTFLGSSTGWYNQTGVRSTIVGSGAGLFNKASYNTFVGSLSGQFNQWGEHNVYIGLQSGQNTTSAFYNTCIGSKSGRSITNGDGNIMIGYRAGYNDSGSNKLYIANGTTADSTIIYGEIENRKMGMWTTSPIANLHIVGTDTLATILIAPNESSSEDDSELILAEDNDNTYNMSIKYDGGDNKLYVYGKANTTIYGPHLSISRNNGEIFMPGVYGDAISVSPRDLYISSTGQLGYIVSSKKYKKNIKNMESTDWLYELRPVNFNYKKNNSDIKEYGLIAEEVEKVNKLFVSYNEKGKVETVSYSKLITPMLKALIDQKNRISILESQNNDLKTEIEEIRSLLNQSTKK